MRLLLDTHAFLWFVLGDARLSPRARTEIERLENVRLLSVASLWEIAIKVSLRRLDLKVPLPKFVDDHVVGNAIMWLPIEPRHVLELVQLPQHHRDPFDRLLAVQAIVEGARMVSGDASLDAYGVDRLW